MRSVQRSVLFDPSRMSHLSFQEWRPYCGVTSHNRTQQSVSHLQLRLICSPCTDLSCKALIPSSQSYILVSSVAMSLGLLLLLLLLPEDHFALTGQALRSCSREQ